MITWLGLIGAIVLPLWNIPLIARIRQRRSSKDISMAWALGVFACLVLMLPSGLASADPVYKLFAILNVCCFGVVVVCVIRYR